MRQTSLDAYKTLEPTKSDMLRRHICALLEIRPMTHEELIEELGDAYSPSGVRARCSELLSEEYGCLVRASGRYKPSRHDKPMIVWELNRQDPDQMELF
jgi:hypothetical protein